MPKQQYRSITLRSMTGDIRTAQFEGRKHIIVPVVALVEGVIQAMNAPYPEFVPAEVFSVAPSGWNGRPIFLNHPMEGSSPVSGNTPEILERSLGRLFNTTVSDKRLLTEAWLDEERVKKLGTEEAALLTRVQSDKEVEISTGAFVILASDKKGTYSGTQYQGQWERIYPDHLAMLSEGSRGACSYKMGCGVRAAANGRMTVRYLSPLGDVPPFVKGKRDPKKKRKLAEGGSMNGFLRGMKEKLGEIFGMMSPSEMGDMDLRNALADALTEIDSNFRYSGDVVMVYPNQSWVVYMMYGQGGPEYYRQTYTMAANGEATLDGAPIECERVVIYPPVDVASEEAEGEPTLTTAMAQVVALAGARHSKTDQAMVQTMHDTSVSLGADCAEVKAASAATPCGCHETTALQPASW